MVSALGRKIFLCYGMICITTCVVIGASEPYIPFTHRDCPFEFVNLDNMNVVMYCPAHAHGSTEEATEELKTLVARQPIGKKASVWVCRSNQLETLKVFGSLADNMFLNITAFTSDVPAEPNDLLWPELDHPFINHIRQLRKAPNTRNLYAVIDFTSEYTSHFKKRSPAFEEIKWMTLAAIGCDFQGINWRDSESCQFLDKIQELETQISAYKDELGHSIPVDWVTSSKTIPISARASKSYLFVTALNPDYFRISEQLEQISMPISLEPEVGLLKILLPDKMIPSTGKTLSGRTLKIQSDKDQIQVDYSFWGAGDMMIFKLEPATHTKP